MRISHLAYLIPAFAAASLAQAQDPLVYLQFGSYESRAEAEEKLDGVANAHAGILGALPMGIREVAIAEGLTVYRTQAGPLDSRATAQSMCAQLASNGDACYILETAIQIAQPATPRLPAAPQAQAAAKREVTNALKPLNNEIAEMQNEAVADVNAAQDKIPMIGQPVRSDRDARNMQTLAQVTTPEAPRVEIARPVVAVPSASPEMEAALAQAASVAPRTVTAPASFKEQEEESFWDAINPFSSSDEPSIEQQMAADEALQPPGLPNSENLQVRAPTIATPRLDDVSFDENVASPMVITAVPAAPDASAARAELPRVSIDDIIQQTSDASAAAPVDSGLPLLAPPLPRHVADKVARESSRPLSTGRPINEQPMIQSRAVPSASMPAMPRAQGNTTITAVMPDGGAVQVEEAQRVPLSEEPAAPPARPVVASRGPLGLKADQMPSQSRQFKTVWAQLNYFDTPQQALRFWDGFRNQNPDYPVVRVRVTSPYQSLQSTNKQYSLRIGPFTNSRFIENLCDSDPVDDQDLECRSLSDLGYSANHKLNLNDQRGVYQAARYGGVARGIQALPGFWVQLGSYNSMGHAENGWEALKQEYASVLSSMNVQVSTPDLGSQSQPVYRLRAGPFVNQNAAEELCGRLKEEQASCLVVANNVQ